MKNLLYSLILFISGCVQRPRLVANLPALGENLPATNGGLSKLVYLGCVGIAVAIGFAVANMGKGLKSIVLGVICGAGTLIGIVSMLQYYSKWIAMIFMVGFIITALAVFSSLFVDSRLTFWRKND